ncbi:hypothetical protein HDZ31DRAFT_63717 [Schizophyllum fasciatum]
MDRTDGDWQLIARDWWRTPVEGASWADVERARPADGGGEEAVWPPAPRPRGPLVHLRPGEPAGSRRPADDMRLSSELPGVRGAGDVLADYEAAVGFDDGAPRWDRPLRAGGADAGPWRELVDALAGLGAAAAAFDAPTRSATPADGDDELFDGASPAASSSGSLHRSTSTLSSLDFSELHGSSRASSWSVPATPKVAPVDVVVESPEQELHDPLSSSPRRTITASPQLIPPSPAVPPKTPPSPAPSFTFPTLDVKIIKDDQGFYSQVEDVARPQADALLPPFLHDTRRRRPQSKTRAIVDSLRSPAMHDSGYGKIGVVRNGRKSSGTVDALELPTPSTSASPSGASALSAPSPSSSSRDSSRSSSERRSLSEDEGWYESSPAPAPARPQSPPRPSLTTQRHEHAEAARERFLALHRARFEPPSPPPPPVEEEQPQQYQRSTSAGSQQSAPSSQKGSKHTRSASKSSRKHRRSGSKSVSVPTPAPPPEPVPVPAPSSHPIFYPGYGAFMPQAAYGPMYGAPMPPQPPAQPLFVPQYAPPQAMYAPALPPPLLSPSMAMKPHMIKFMSPMNVPAVPRMRAA